MKIPNFNRVEAAALGALRPFARLVVMLPLLFAVGSCGSGRLYEGKRQEGLAL